MDHVNIALEKKKKERQRAIERRQMRDENYIQITAATNARHEKLLRDIATRGVVTLFNAIPKHQKLLKDNLQKIDSNSDAFKHRTLKMENQTRNKFIQSLNKQGKQELYENKNRNNNNSNNNRNKNQNKNKNNNSDINININTNRNINRKHGINRNDINMENNEEPLLKRRRKMNNNDNDDNSNTNEKALSFLMDDSDDDNDNDNSGGKLLSLHRKKKQNQSSKKKNKGKGKGKVKQWNVLSDKMMYHSYNKDWQDTGHDASDEDDADLMDY